VAQAAKPASSHPPSTEAGTVSGEDAALLQALGFEPIGLDALQASCGWPTEQLQARLLEWELEGRLARLPGGLFQRLVRG
jgi:DNA processing protein